MQNEEENKPVLTEGISTDTEAQLPSVSGEEENAEVQVSEDEIASLSKTQLVEKLEEIALLDDVQPAVAMARMIKDRFDELVKEEYDRKLKVFMQDGSLEEDFDPAVDPLDKRIEQLSKEFNGKRADQRRRKEKSSQDNLSTKKLIIEELKQLLKGEDNFTKSYQRFQALQTKWRNTGNVPQQESHTLRENYHFLTGKFYDMVKISNELRELDQKKNLEHKTELCEKIERLVEEPSLNKALSGLRVLQEEWRETGFVAKTLGDPVWNRFKAATDKLYERRKEHTVKQKEQQEVNLSAKAALCGQLEALAQADLSSHKACRDASEKAEAIWVEWQKTGFVPKSDNGDCWKRFKKARQNFYDVLDVFYAKQRQEFGGNLEKKTELCLKAEALKESTDWSATAEALKKLQVQWKDIGQVARKDSDAIWNRFRKACDHFFESKNAHFAEKENALRANVQVKEAIVIKIDQLQASADINQSIEELKKIQEEWVASGQVPYKESERLNNAFGKAVENHLEKIKTSSGGDGKIFYRLKYEQMLKSPQGQEQIKRERFAIQDKIKKLQTEVNQLENNLGFFGKSKKPNPFIAEYQQKLDESKKQIKELNDQLKVIPAPVEEIVPELPAKKPQRPGQGRRR